MKKSELKSLVKNCVKEVLLEEGVLSDIIAEVAFGIAKAQSLMTETTTNLPTPAADTRIQESLQKERHESKKRQLTETKQRLSAAIGAGSMKNIFEGTEPLASAGSPNSLDAPSSPLSGTDPKDSGVDITGIFNLAGNKWKHLK